MAKTLDYTDESPHDTKLGDTSTVVSLQLATDGNAFDLTGTTEVQIRVGDASNAQVSAQDVDLGTITDPLSGVISFPINNSLKVGNHNLEVHVTNSNGVSVFPSEGFLQFTINQNIGD